MPTDTHYMLTEAERDSARRLLEWFDAEAATLGDCAVGRIYVSWADSIRDRFPPLEAAARAA